MDALIHNNKVVVPYQEIIHSALPLSKVLDQGAKRFSVVEHGVAETKILRNIGFNVPAPILSQYDWAGSTPFDSQKETAAMLSTEPRAYCLSSMGVGKTRAALYAFDFMYKTGAAQTMLVIAPLSTLVNVWEREVFESFYHLRTAVLHGTKKQRLQALEQPAEVYIINHDGVATILKELVDKKISVVAIDELASLRNAQTKRWKMVNHLINKVPNPPVAWGLTGSPTPNEPTDAFGQVKLLTPNQVPRSFKRFQQDTMTQVTQFKWVPKKDANETVAKAMKPSIRFTLDECHDIPETTYSMRHVEPSATQAQVYRAVVDKFKAEIKGRQITAVNEGAKLSKLLQISGGFAYDGDKGIYIDAKARIKEVVDVIEQADKKVLVFANYKWMIRALTEVIGNFFTVATITGDTPKKERDATFASFRKSKDPHVIIAHAGTMAHGLTLIEADTIIWYGPPQSAELYEQANARIRRAGQKLHTHVIHIESTPVEKQAFLRLQKKQKMQGLLLDMFRGAQE